MAKIGLDALEYWLKVKRHDVTPYLADVLPTLNEYLLLPHTPIKKTESFSDHGTVYSSKSGEDKNVVSM